MACFSRGSATYLREHVLQLDDEAVCLAAPAVSKPVHVIVVDNEPVAFGTEVPSQARVGSDRIADVVVLDEAIELKVGRDVQPNARSHERLVEAAPRDVADVPLDRHLKRHECRWRPATPDLELVERSVVKTSECPIHAAVELAFCGELPPDFVAHPLVRSRRDDNAVGNFERLINPLPRGCKRDPEAVAAFEVHEEGYHSHPVAFPPPRDIGE